MAKDPVSMSSQPSVAYEVMKHTPLTKHCWLADEVEYEARECNWASTLAKMITGAIFLPPLMFIDWVLWKEKSKALTVVICSL